MIITFFGHANYTEKSEHRQLILNYLETLSSNSFVEFYLGGYGKFDSFALSCAKEFQAIHTEAKIYFITPYISPSYEKNHLKYNAAIYDGIIYPPLESTHPKYAISYRNKWMIEQADVVIAFVKRQSGGAFSAFRRAQGLGKQYFNVATGKMN